MRTIYLGMFAICIVMASMATSAAPALAVTETRPLALPFRYNFDQTSVLRESANAGLSTSPYFWLNSGALLNIRDGFGYTNQGVLPVDDIWRRWYSLTRTDALITDGGARPQNLFRMFTRTRMRDVSQVLTFKVNEYNVNTSKNRNASNGIFFVNRMHDKHNSYFTGIRVDGLAVIKKKINDKYYTLLQTPYVPAPKYDRTTNPNLMPHDTWIRMKSEIENYGEDGVRIKLYADIGNTGAWKLLATAIDDGKSYGGPAFLKSGFAGIRTDFMDVVFDQYLISAIHPGAEPVGTPPEASAAARAPR